MSLRGRVAVLTAAVTVVVVAVAGVLVLTSFRSNELQRLDNQLSDQWRDLSQASVAVLRSTRPSAQQLLDLGLQAPLSVRVMDRSGVVLSMGAGPVDGFDDAAPVGFSTVEAGEQRWRVLAGPVSPRARPGQTYEVQFASPLGAFDAGVGDLRRRVWVVGLLMSGVAAGLGWVIGGVGLRPISRLRRRAAEVAATTDLSLRVDPDQGAPEVDELAADLNLMLERLEAADHDRASALDAARSFAAAAAHELRTPLTSMQANIDVLARYDELGPEERSALVGDLASQQQRIRELLEALRMLARGDLARPEAFEAVDIADLVEVAVGEAQRRMPEVAYTTDVDRSLPPLRGWREGLRVMIDNLLVNATTHGRPASGRSCVHVEVARVDGGIRLAVGDNGPGIAGEERSAVLERFHRGRSAVGTGSGLGLALVRQQAELHSGALAVGQSALGGAEIEITLPLGLA